MKVKEVERTANVAWSPATQHPIYLAAGTAAQQLDATFSTTASLEIYGLNLTEPGLDMSLRGSISSDCRFHKIVWSSHGMSTEDYPNGVIVGGADGGNLFMFDAAKLVKGEMALICQRDKHSGPVTALDFNPFQINLLASGASESEIYIWDLNSPNSPMTPGAKSQLGEMVTCVAWNRQVQHILASTFPARCVVWDLRKNEPIIKVSDSMSRIRCKAVAWHPEVATQMCLASEDDHTPYIQLWDLRFATSPLKTLENHQRGVLSIAWCPQDPDLLMSCGKDSRILCWNPNSNAPGGEIVWELPTSNQWSFDVSWCPRNPAIIGSASFDGHVSIYSLMGGQQQIQPSSKIADSFPGSASFASPLPSQMDHRGFSVTLTKPPKWLRIPVGASFGFGGKLVTFENVKPSAQNPQVQRIVHVSQVVTESSFVSRSAKLENVLSTGNVAEFCQSKLANTISEEEGRLWKFVKASFDESPRISFLNLLGYDPQEVGALINATISANPPSRGQGDADGVDAEELAVRMNALGSTSNSLRASPNFAANLSSSHTPESLPAVPSEGVAAFDAIATLHSEDISPGSPPHLFTIPTDEDTDGLISKSLLIGNLDVAVNLCLREKRYADAMILAMAGGKDLLARTQKKYFKQAKGELSMLIASVVNQDWALLVKNCDLKCWKEALAACLTHAKLEEFSPLCAVLGSRLETENDADSLFNAILCYICAGNIEKMAECWVKMGTDSDNSTALQDLVELIMIMRQAAEKNGQQYEITSGMLASKLSQYSYLLASQGSLATALNYLGSSNEPSIVVLRERLYLAQNLPHGTSAPTSGFPKMEIKPSVGLQSKMVPPMSNVAPTAVQPIPMTQHMKPVGYPTPMSAPSSYMYSPATMSYQLPAMSHSAVSSSFPVGAPSSSVAPLALPTGPQPVPTPVAPIAPPTGPPPSVASNQPQTNMFTKGNLSHRYPTLPQDPSVINPSTSYGQSYYSPQQPSSPTASAFPTTHNMSNIAPVMPNFSAYNPPANQSNGYTQTSVQDYSYGNSNPPQMATSTSYSTSNYSPYTPPTQTQMVSGAYDEFKSGWNDPPTLKNVPKSSAGDYQSPAPITRPIFNSPEVEPPLAPPINYSNSNYMQPSNPTSYVMSQPAPPVQEKMAPIITPEVKKPKGPIPAENQILYDIFENLRNRCATNTANPQIKRKLEDVARKLESLYDKLRENGLTQPTILGLHQIVQVVQQGDYQSALGIHAQIVSMGNFSEFGSFMPGLKVLLQTSQQLNVYIM